ncbi:hypothetical protein [Pseudomonas parasichuanensis]|uniref:hypothetical protein n=1 Tax=Pseudomonas parasichuanensis TaxID=2892329 RepID=UPI001F35B77F|nr:hypothetical protein [Pseudomonas parasichuanensis]
MKLSIEGLAEAGEDLIQKAIDAQRRLRQAEDAGAPTEEIERLKTLAESLFQAITDYQLHAFGGPG